MDLFSPRHLLIVLLIVLVVFGTKKLKTIGADLGGAVRGFKNAMGEGEAEAKSDAHAEAPKESPRITADATAAPAPATKTPNNSSAQS